MAHGSLAGAGPVKSLYSQIGFAFKSKCSLPYFSPLKTARELFLSAQTSPVLLPVSLRERGEAGHCSGGTIPGVAQSQALQEQGLRPGGLHQSRPQDAGLNSYSSVLILTRGTRLLMPALTPLCSTNPSLFGKDLSGN